MSKTRKVLLIGTAVYLGVFVLLILVYGFTQHKNNEFQIQNEFKIVQWVHLGVFSINRAVIYLFLATILTIGTMLWISRRMQARPNKIQTSVEVIYSLMRDNITRGNMPDSMAAKWFPFLGTLFLFIWYCNLIGYLPLPTNSGEKFTVFGARIPDFALYAATANISIPLVFALVVFIAFNWVGVRAQGPIGYLKSLIPAGVHGPMLLLIFPIEVISTLMRLLSLTIRLWANIFAGHIILLFLAGGLAVILGLQALGWFALPAGVLIYIFELGLVATLQAFIFATLAAIYIGGAVSHH
ncbi:MAG TPA: F0F1 ATP synthase subunit A [Solirubrobacteraceae bacterium]